MRPGCRHGHHGRHGHWAAGHRDHHQGHHVPEPRRPDGHGRPHQGGRHDRVRRAHRLRQVQPADRTLDGASSPGLAVACPGRRGDRRREPEPDPPGVGVRPVGWLQEPPAAHVAGPCPGTWRTGCCLGAGSQGDGRRARRRVVRRSNRGVGEGQAGPARCLEPPRSASPAAAAPARGVRPVGGQARATSPAVRRCVPPGRPARQERGFRSVPPGRERSRAEPMGPRREQRPVGPAEAEPLRLEPSRPELPRSRRLEPSSPSS